MVVGVDDPDVERVRMRAVAPDRILRDQRADHLAVVGVDEHTGFHGRASRARGRMRCRLISNRRCVLQPESTRPVHVSLERRRRL